MFDNINMIGSAVIIIFKKYRVFFKQGTETNFPQRRDLSSLPFATSTGSKAESTLQMYSKCIKKR